MNEKVLITSREMYPFYFNLTYSPLFFKFWHIRIVVGTLSCWIARIIDDNLSTLSLYNTAPNSLLHSMNNFVFNVWDKVRVHFGTGDTELFRR